MDTQWSEDYKINVTILGLKLFTKLYWWPIKHKLATFDDYQINHLKILGDEVVDMLSKLSLPFNDFGDV